MLMCKYIYIYTYMHIHMYTIMHIQFCITCVCVYVCVWGIVNANWMLFFSLTRRPWPWSHAEKWAHWEGSHPSVMHFLRALHAVALDVRQQAVHGIFQHFPQANSATAECTAQTSPGPRLYGVKRRDSNKKQELHQTWFWSPSSPSSPSSSSPPP